MAPFLWTGFNCVKVAGPLLTDSLFLPPSTQEDQVFNWSTSDGWKAEPTIEWLSVFELGTPGFGF